jgi:hypothetical protein
MAGGERDLGKLLADPKPELLPDRYSFEIGDDQPMGESVFALVREEEGITAIRTNPEGEWARITLGIHSNLEAVGMTAAFSKALTDAGISANVVAGLHHDHIFVPWDRREDALKALRRLGG